MESFKQETIDGTDIVRLNIQLTKRCNQRCVSCNSYELSPSEELTAYEIEHVIEDVTDNFEIKNIAFTGGEPTLFDDIFRVADFASKRSENVSITTECPLWRTDLYIESNGNVRTGCWLLPPVGNIRRNSIKEIFGEKSFWKNVETMKAHRCEGCTCGYMMQAKYMQ